MAWAHPHRYFHVAVACGVFVAFCWALMHAPGAMLGDTDPLWHLAAGDLIRTQGQLPLVDPFSFTAGEYHWLNVAWLWDVGLSWVHEKGGWHSAMGMNALLVSACFTLIFLACLTRSGSVAASLLTMFFAVFMMSSLLRPLQVTMFFTALWLWLLGQIIRGRICPAHLLWLPASMLLWVNSHGGFPVGLIMLGLCAAQALYFHHHRLARQLLLTLGACLLACLCTPYGFEIVETVRRPLMTQANQFIAEWQPLSLSSDSLVRYLPVLLLPMAAMRVGKALSPAEKLQAWLWWLMGLLSVRHLPIFAIVSAPMIACALAPTLRRLLPPAAGEAMRFCYNRKIAAQLGLLACACMAVWLPLPSSGRHFPDAMQAVPSLASEIAYIEKNHPRARLLTHFNLGGIVLYETRGRLPVFIDPRTETAYPAQLMKDYMAFESLAPGWEALFDRYRLDGVLLPHADGKPKLQALHAAFSQRNGWKMAFEGPSATLYLRQRDVGLDRKQRSP